MSRPAAPAPAAARWFRRLLRLCPPLVAVLWVAGVAQFRHYQLQPVEWAVLVAASFALQTLVARLRPARPLPPLPAGSNPAAVAGLAALLCGAFVFAVGGALEWLVEPYRPSETPWLLRSLWHAACAVGATYCGFLLRLSAPRG